MSKDFPKANTPAKFYFGVIVDKINMKLGVAAFSLDREAVLRDTPVRLLKEGFDEDSVWQVFQLSDTTPSELYHWLHELCRLTHSDATEAVRELGKSMQEMFDEIAAEKGWKLTP